MSHPPAQPSTDAFIERIVREVIRRLLAMETQAAGSRRLPGSGGNVFSTPAVSAPYPISEKLITAATLETIPVGTTEVLLPGRAVVTPLARDEAKSRGIRLTRVDPSNHPEVERPR